MSPFCVRFYDDAVREVGSAILTLQSDGTVADILAEAARQLQPEWGIKEPLRLLEVTESRLHKLHSNTNTTPVSSLQCFNKANIFYHCLRVESDDSACQSDQSLKL